MGPGGYVAAKKAAKLGMSVVIIDKDVGNLYQQRMHSHESPGACGDAVPGDDRMRKVRAVSRKRSGSTCKRRYMSIRIFPSPDAEELKKMLFWGSQRKGNRNDPERQKVR